MNVVICMLLLAQAESRTYHRVTLAQMATTKYTHVSTCGPVVYARRQRDGDLHVTLDDGRAKVVVEFLPSWAGALPKKGERIRVRGISRIDKHHKWAEVHPAEAWERVTSCQS